MSSYSPFPSLKSSSQSTPDHLEVSSPHLYRPRSTSFPYPHRRSSPAHSLLAHVSSYLPRRIHSPRRHRNRRPSWRTYLSPSALALILAWALLLLRGERRIYTAAISACQWESWESWPEGARPHRLVMVADPQLVDMHTYARRGPALAATIFYTDLYLRRSWASIHSILSPSDSIFLGDLFDGGREWSVAVHRRPQQQQLIPDDPRGKKDWKKKGTNKYWFREFARFQRVFPTPAGTRAWKSLPGNHDLGFGGGVKLDVRERFESYIGPTNRVFEVGNHTFVAVDTVSLSNEADQKVFGPPKEFLDSLAVVGHHARGKREKFPHGLLEQKQQQGDTQKLTREIGQPTILLTHVPLYRPKDTPCGPLREKGTSIPIWRGYQYQNVLSQPLSTQLLAATKARHVFSGDDHDACEVQHHYGPEGVVQETTVKSASWAMGIRYPAVLLVSLWTGTEGKETVQTKMCFLPDQIGVFIGYAVAAAATAVACAVAVAVRRRRLAGREAERNGGILPVTEERDDGQGKYWKPVARGQRSGWRWWVMEIGRELGTVAGAVGIVYLWSIWRW